MAVALKSEGKQSAARTKSALKNMAWAGSLKGLSLLVNLATVPAYLSFFGDRGALGLWFTAISLVNWTLTLDFGLGNGLRNSLVVSLAANDAGRSREDISGTYGASIVLAVVLAIFGGLAIWVIDWDSLLGLDSLDMSLLTARTVMGMLFAAVIIQSVLRIVSFALYAIQRPAVNNVLSLLTSSFVLLAVTLLPPARDSGDIVGLSGLYAAAVVTPLLVATLITFSWGPLVGMGPRLSLMRVASMKRAYRSGGVFFYNQVLYTLIFTSTPVLITSLIGPAATTDFQIYYTLFIVPATVMMLALTPMWSAVTLALVESDTRWILIGLRRMEMVVLGVVGVEVGLIFIAPAIFHVWLGRAAPEGSALGGVSLAAYAIAFSWHAVLATFASGLSKLRLQAVCYSIGLFVKLAGAMILSNYWGNWAVVPFIDAGVLLVYCSLEHRSVRKRLTSFT